MFTFVVILVLGVLSRQYLGRALRLPYTVILMVLGALTGLLIENRRNAFELNLKSWYDMTPQVILYRKFAFYIRSLRSSGAGVTVGSRPRRALPLRAAE